MILKDSHLWTMIFNDDDNRSSPGKEAPSKISQTPGK